MGSLRAIHVPNRAKYHRAAEYETPTADPARSRKEATVTIYDRIMKKAYEIQHMPQVHWGRTFYVWNSRTLKVFLQAQDSLRVFAMAKPNGHFEVVADHYLLVWGDERPHFTHVQYVEFVSKIKAALARIKK